MAPGWQDVGLRHRLTVGARQRQREGAGQQGRRQQQSPLHGRSSFIEFQPVGGREHRRPAARLLQPRARHRVQPLATNHPGVAEPVIRGLRIQDPGRVSRHGAQRAVTLDLTDQRRLLDLSVRVAVPIPVSVTVSVDIGVSITVGIFIAVGVSITVTVGVGIAIAIGIPIAIRVSVAIDVAIAIAIGRPGVETAQVDVGGAANEHHESRDRHGMRQSSQELQHALAALRGRRSDHH